MPRLVNTMYRAEDREDADESELFAQAREDVVALGDRRELRASLAEAGADQASLREPEEALHELEAGAVDR